MFSACTHYTRTNAQEPANYSLDIIIQTAKLLQ